MARKKKQQPKPKRNRFVDGPDEHQFIGYQAPGSDEVVPLDEMARRLREQRKRQRRAK